MGRPGRAGVGATTAFSTLKLKAKWLEKGFTGPLFLHLQREVKFWKTRNKILKRKRLEVKARQPWVPEEKGAILRKNVFNLMHGE